MLEGCLCGEWMTIVIPDTEYYNMTCEVGPLQVQNGVVLCVRKWFITLSSNEILKCKMMVAKSIKY